MKGHWHQELRRLVGGTLVYGVGNVVLRAVNVLLIPLYTAVLTTQDYGAISVSTSVIAFLGVLLPIGLHAAVARCYFDVSEPKERNEAVVTLWVGSVIAACVSALALLPWIRLTGPWLFTEPGLSDVPALTLGIALFNTVTLVPFSYLQVSERSRWFVAATAASVLLNASCVVGGVVVLRLGVLGYLWGLLSAAGIGAVVCACLMFRMGRLRLRLPLLVQALKYSLPLVPHGLAGWALEVSDRLLLQKFVPLSEVGIYALGYQYGAIMTMAASAFSGAWVPVLFRNASSEKSDASKGLAHLATYYVVLLLWGGLALALAAPEGVALLGTPEYSRAADVAPWVVLGGLFNGLYLLPANLLFLRSKTIVLPFATISAGVLKVAVSLWSIPLFGIVAAAWTTAMAYGVMLVVTWAAASRWAPFPYEYRRMALVSAVALSFFAAGHSLSFEASSFNSAGKATLVLSFPFLLLWLGVPDAQERLILRNLLARCARVQQV